MHKILLIGLILLGAASGSLISGCTDPQTATRVLAQMVIP